MTYFSQPEIANSTPPARQSAYRPRRTTHQLLRLWCFYQFSKQILPLLPGRPAADLSNNCVVDYADLDIMANEWLDKGAAVVADLYRDDDVDAKDFAVLADAWLEQLLWP